MILKCLLDRCPQTGNPVDMRICCTNCPWYGAKPWSEFGQVTCNHPKAHPNSPAQREANAGAFRATAPFAGHLLYAGPRR